MSHLTGARPRRLLLAAALAVAVFALLPAAGAGPHARAHDDCRFDVDDLVDAVGEVDIIVVGEIIDVEGTLGIAPEAYLKGSALQERLFLGETFGECAGADRPPAGARVIAALVRARGVLHWPIPAALFVVEGGVATNGADPPVALPEDDLVERIRDVSGQYAELARESEGSSFNLLRVVLPVVAAAVVILAIALALLRVWHRIEPE